jgi:2-methylcitrate dehydratase PrpD
MSTPAQRLASFASSLTLGDIPSEVVAAAELHLLDTLGCGLAAHALDTAPYVREAMAAEGGVGPASAIGVAGGLTARDAAMVNGAGCHALDFDDTHPGAVAHVSVAVAPAALAVGEQVGASGEELLVAIVAGNEVCIRIGMAAGEAFHARGFHPTAIAGVFGAAAAACKLRGLDAETTAQALGIAGSLAAGILEFLSDGSSTKRLHAGFAASSGVTAAALAAHGATGPRTVLEGRFGLYNAFLGGAAVDIESQLSDLGVRWETPRIAFKPYPACHYLHAPLDATIAAVTEESLEIGDIEELVVVSPPAGVAMVLEPSADKARPRSEYEAKFSLPYSVASYLTHGRVDVSTYTDEAIADEQVLELAGTIRYEVEAFPTAGRAFPGGARIRMKDGRVIERTLLYQRGDPDNPMDAPEVVEKFRTNAALALPRAEVERIESAVMALADEADLGFLGALAGASRELAR